MTDQELDELEARLREHARKGMAQPRNFPPYYREADEKRAADAIAELRKEKAGLVGALEFYADPDTYVAISFFEDRPCGEFMDDFGPDDDEEYQRPMPGKRARQALKENTQ